MVDVDKLLEMWEKDCVIDEMALDTTSSRFASIHAKYLRIYTDSKMLLKHSEMKMEELRKDKWLWFHGKMPREELEKRGWKSDPFDGQVRPLKSDLEMFFETDPDIVKLKAKNIYLNTALETLKEILDTIRWRHSVVRNVLDAKKFYSGAG
jgi:hypothetical protein